jgi:hypothetical protein
MEHFTLGFATGLLVWLAALLVHRIKGREFPLASSTGRRIFNALIWGLVGGAANVAVDIDFLIHQWQGLPYRFWHTPVLIIGAVMTLICLVYLWRNPPGRRTSAGFLILVVGLSFVTHVLQDYLLGWF